MADAGYHTDTTVRIDWIDDLAGIESLKGQWTALESEVNDRTVFSCYDFIIPWYRHYGGKGSEKYGAPLLGAAWKDGALVGIAPFTRFRGTLGKVPVRRVELAGFNAEAGELLVPDNMPELAGLFIDSLVARGGFDVITLNGVAPASVKNMTIGDAARKHGLKTERSEYRYAVVDLSHGYESYFKTLNSKVRNSLNRHMRKISSGAWLVESVSGRIGSGLASETLRRMFSIYDASWKAMEGGALCGHHRAFYEDIVSRFSGEGMVEVFFLKIDGRDAAFIFWLAERGFYYDVTVSYDESYAHLSPGIVLMHDTLKTLCRRSNVHTVVSHGDREYKKNWASRFDPMSRTQIFSTGVLARLSHFIKFGRPVLLGALLNGKRSAGESDMTAKHKGGI